jgi:hypothetical protein
MKAMTVEQAYLLVMGFLVFFAIAAVVFLERHARKRMAAENKPAEEWFK